MRVYIFSDHLNYDKGAGPDKVLLIKYDETCSNDVAGVALMAHPIAFMEQEQEEST